MLRILLLSGLCAGFFADQADAKTIRYEFDIVSSSFSVGRLYEYDTPYSGPGRLVLYDDPLYQEVISAILPRGYLVGQTGHVSMQLSGDEWTLSSVECHSGILCTEFNQFNGLISLFYSSFGSTGFQIYAWRGARSGEWALGGDPATGTGSIYFTDDSPAGGGGFNGKYYTHDGARASFTLANLTITEIDPVPLPASAPLLAVGMMVFGCKARRRKRAA